ncbi:hypothetical protein ACNTMW_24595 [Planosporangium sp. 12N6]|uniref:hypothetical protein n=1 Tax=Planosporangium spinosum TaxID=3402278 RepID=UPI003CF0738E
MSAHRPQTGNRWGGPRDEQRIRREAGSRPLPPANWYPDPSWRHQFRYWDGCVLNDVYREARELGVQIDGARVTEVY